MEEKKSGAQLLGIDRPEEWVREKTEKAYLFADDNIESLDSILTFYLKQHGLHQFAQMIRAHRAQGIFAELCKITFALGYLKGRDEAEQLADLDKVYGKEEGKEEKTDASGD